MNQVTYTTYTPEDHQSLLQLLLELQRDYFSETAAPEIRELRQDKNITKSYDDYVSMIDNVDDGTWHAILARTSEKVVGFIIGSISTDDGLVLEKTGKVEDWYVAGTYRGEGIGVKLYGVLEQWFRREGCMQVSSDTWQGNQLSIDAHLRQGFFISGIIFGKKL